MAAPITGSGQAGGSGKTDGGTTIVLLLAFAVFFILGGVTNINDLLVGKFKPMFQLSHAQANLVQMAFFIAYALVSIPAGIVMSRLGYIRTFVLGFLMVAAAALLFVPASASASYGGFLAALFFIGAGITVLQVAMNPIITTLGPPETAHSRLTFAQAFNSIGVFLMVYGGATVLLGGETHFDAATATPEAIKAYQVEQGASIGHAYFWLAMVMLGMAAVFWAFRRSLDHAKAEKAQVAGTLDLLKSNRRVQLGALGIFTYVGAEVAIGSNLIAYLGDQRTMGLGLEAAGKLVAYYWLGALIGRLAGGFILRLFKPGRVLTAFAAGAIGLIVLSAVSAGALSGWALVAVGLCNSLMFPTIFSLGTEGLGEQTPQGSGIMCTAIVGGAIIPVAFGLVADFSHDLRFALIVPAVCYLFIASFGIWAVNNPSKAKGEGSTGPVFE
ncbi:MAG: sugar MFS transporter [Novosphingobium sp.]